MNIKAYSVDTDLCDKRRADDVFVFRENGLFHDPKKQANMYMALSHKYIDADISLYMAGNIILRDMNLKKIAKDLLKNKDIAIYKHPKRNCIYKEAASISNKEDPKIMKIQMDKYRELGYPENNGLVETGMIIRRHTPEVIAFNNAWFAELCLYSKRSQLSFNYVLSLFPDLKVNIIDGNIRKGLFFYQRKHNRTYLARSIKRPQEEIKEEEIKEEFQEKVVEFKKFSKDNYRTIVIIRSRYESSLSDLRMELFQKYCIDSLKTQTNKDFEVHVLVQRQTIQQIKRLDWGELNVKFLIETPGMGWVNYAEKIREEYLNEANLQIRLDNDDWVDESFIEKTKILIQGQENILITYHPTKYLYDTGEKYFSQKRYNENHPSMFFAIYQSNAKHWILDRQHGQMGRLFKKGLSIKEFGLCNLTIHSENQLNIA